MIPASAKSSSRLLTIEAKSIRLSWSALSGIVAAIHQSREIFMPAKLRSSEPSPFARKCRVAIKHLNLEDQVVIEPAATQDPNDTLRQQNPLGKLPALVLDDGQVIVDSRVIMEYLDTLAGGGKIIPQETDERFKTLTLAALCDGVMEASILLIYEKRHRPDREPHEGALNHQRAKIERTLNRLQETPPGFNPVSIGNIGLACALGYMDYRKQYDWRTAHPKLITWLDGFSAAAPAFGSAPHPDE